MYLCRISTFLALKKSRLAAMEMHGFFEVDTHVLNCTVNPRYNGEKAYATPPATAKNAPHCKTGQLM